LDRSETLIFNNFRRNGATVPLSFPTISYTSKNNTKHHTN
jgi:hypothetical protein